MAAPAPLTFVETGSFTSNLTLFESHLDALDGVLGPATRPHLTLLADGKCDRALVLKDLMIAVEVAAAKAKAGAAQPAASAAVPAGAAPAPPAAAPAAPAAPQPTPKSWFLEKLEIEGFRGINNETGPLVLKFNPEAVTSISAPNGVGKSSIFDALMYAFSKSIPKLEGLGPAEKGKSYYLNRFHKGGAARIALTLRPNDGSVPVVVTVKLDVAGNRSVSTSDGSNGEVLLAELNREFVLLDGPTFHKFIDGTSLERGRNFAGLLGLARYSALRQSLQTLSNTTAFNNAYDRSAVKARKQAATKALDALRPTIAADYQSLIKTPLDASISRDQAHTNCHSALNGIPALSTHCTGKVFDSIDLDACLSAILAEEGGAKKTRHTAVVREISELEASKAKGPAEADVSGLVAIAARRDKAVGQTSGDLLAELYRVSEKVLLSEGWPSPTTCPTCERDDGTSVLDAVQTKLAEYEKVDEETQSGVTAWTAGAWADLGPLAPTYLQGDALAQYKVLSDKGAKGELSETECKQLVSQVSTIRAGAISAIATLGAEREALEKELPPSLVAATAAVETARRLQLNWRQIVDQESAAAAEVARENHIDRIKKFVDGADGSFATAESVMASVRLQKVLPVCRGLFAEIMGKSVVPALSKKAGGEDLTISLASFFTLTDVSAQALLSESFRNGFAVSVYLAAASLYGGAPRFMILDDVTSSFDAGHQLNLVEVMRLKFARPMVAHGPQLIILSHDTMLEKLFNRNNGSSEWQHQRLEGSPQSAVLLQAGAVNKVRDGTNDLLNQGRVADAAPFIRQYLEYQLQTIISKCNIPVPIDVAYNDDKKMAGNLLTAIEDAVKLYKKAGDLVLEPGQQTDLQTRAAAITSNFVSHWATGSTSAFSATSLQTVMAAIDTLADCFQYAPTVGAPKKFYRSLSQR